MPKLFEANKDDSPRGGPRVTQSGFSGSRGRPGTKRTFRVASRKLAAEWRCSPIPKGVGPRVFCVSTFSSTSKAAFSSGKGTPFLRTSWFADSAWADDGRRLQGARRPEPEPTAGPPDARNRQSLQELSERCGHGRKSLIRHLGDPGGSDLMTTIGPGRRIQRARRRTRSAKVRLNRYDRDPAQLSSTSSRLGEGSNWASFTMTSNLGTPRQKRERRLVGLWRSPARRPLSKVRAGRFGPNEQGTVVGHEAPTT